MPELKTQIIEVLNEILDEEEITPPQWQDSTILLETGMDSLGFAVVVSRLENLLGYDPFSMMEEAVYPSTLGEFVDVYLQNSPE